MKSIKIIFLILVTLTTEVCYNTTLQVYDTPNFPSSKSEPERTFKQGGYLFGVIDAFETPKIQCSEGKPEILILRNFWDNVIHWTIGGIYTQRTVQIFCKKDTVDQKSLGPG
ncbi:MULTISPECIES: LA_3781 family PerA/PerB upregulated protein [Leptospira]|uniref:Lipoprotein n=5 Tax=Leptospira santarosai TaxID=28183 RepID=A0AB73MNI6_9LEPT|nr:MULTISPECIES: hypothetical protein [Leptospira]EMO59205.1 hypothetical protein LEP1GSC161_0851 [Leptospira santarosai str. CBC1416]AVV50129.1 Uncharacterized protein XB17_01538 [Leptospira santarosai]AVV80719.1 Uncharacterized protein XB15_02975 [Leptospira santarosai]EKO33337.1 hypothetical protein LEP1GSC179_2624 [Leptospira santarosai str. MOR084]EKO79672.1 hypothetical protein LEP1GSC068_3137 [Leptospira sp. Fiocruz LV3954]